MGVCALTDATIIKPKAPSNRVLLIMISSWQHRFLIQCLEGTTQATLPYPFLKAFQRVHLKLPKRRQERMALSNQWPAQQSNKRESVQSTPLFSAVRTAWPTTRPAHSFFELRAYPINVLPPGFRFLDGDDPADPFVACEWRNVLPFCPRNGIGNENLS
jgi:hypothetical protein